MQYLCEYQETKITMKFLLTLNLKNKEDITLQKDELNLLQHHQQVDYFVGEKGNQ